MFACRSCRYVIHTHEKSCPKCGGDLSDKFSGLLVILNPEKSEVAKLAQINAAGTYAVKVR